MESPFVEVLGLCWDGVLRRVVFGMCVTLTPLACSTARNSQSAHARATDLHGRVSLNSVNSVGDTEAWGHRFCVSGEMKALTTSTRCGVRRSAEKELAPFSADVTKVA